MAVRSVFRTQLPPNLERKEVERSIKAIISDPNFVKLEVKGEKLKVVMKAYPDERLISHAIRGVPSEILARFH